MASNALQRCRPRNVTLKMWIDRRIGGEIATWRKDGRRGASSGSAAVVGGWWLRGSMGQLKKQVGFFMGIHQDEKDVVSTWFCFQVF